MHILSAFERVMPVIALAFVLAVQGLVATGAADTFLYPSLVGPDGRVIEAADICNNTGETKHAGSHCRACTQLAAVSLPCLPATPEVPETSPYVPVAEDPQVFVFRHEAHARLHTGPPAA